MHLPHGARNVADETREMLIQAYLIVRTAIDMLPFLVYVIHIALAFTDDPSKRVLHARVCIQPRRVEWISNRDVRPLERESSDETERLDGQRR